MVRFRNGTEQQNSEHELGFENASFPRYSVPSFSRYPAGDIRSSLLCVLGAKPGCGGKSERQDRGTSVVAQADNV
jgi:hypothetical protein